MLASVRVRVTHFLLRVLSRARECSLARSAFWHASVSRVSRERLARFVTFLVSGTVLEVGLRFTKNASFSNALLTVVESELQGSTSIF